MRDIGNDYCCCCFACIPVEVDQGAVRGGKVRNSVEDCAEDLNCVRTYKGSENKKCRCTKWVAEAEHASVKTYH